MQLIRFGLCVLLFAACGPQPSSFLSDGEPQPAHTVLGVLGGWGSCWQKLGNPLKSPAGTPLFRKMERLTHMLERAGHPVSQVASCYSPFKLDPEGKAQYVTSEDRETIQKGGINDITDAVARLIQPKSKVILVGHSYGGWLAMKIHQSLTQRGLHVDGLFTIDPISQNHCDAKKLIKKLPFSTYPGCIEAPRDFTLEERVEMSDTSYWLQIYQRDFKLLKSAAIPQASSNLIVDYNGLKEVTAHLRIAHGNRTWAAIEDWVVN